MPPPGLGSYAAGFVELVAEVGVGGDSEVLPFGLRRQPRSGPARKGVGFVIADVRDRRGPSISRRPRKRESVPSSRQ